MDHFINVANESTAIGEKALKKRETNGRKKDHHPTMAVHRHSDREGIERIRVGKDTHRPYPPMNMVGAPRRALVVFAVSLCGFLLASSGSPASEATNIAVANESVVYVSSVTGSAFLRIGCLPEDRMPAIPEPYRSSRLTAQPGPIVSLLGDWAGSASDALDAHFAVQGEESEIRVEFVLDGSHRVSSAWVLHQVRTSVGGYSLGIRGQEAADLLSDVVAFESLVIEINVFDEVVLVAFSLDGLEQAIARAIACLPGP